MGVVPQHTETISAATTTNNNNINSQAVMHNVKCLVWWPTSIGSCQFLLFPASLAPTYPFLTRPWLVALTKLFLSPGWAFLEEHGSTAANHFSCSVGTVGFLTPASQCAVGDQRNPTVSLVQVIREQGERADRKSDDGRSLQGAASFGNSMMVMRNQPVTDLVSRTIESACLLFT